MKRPTTVLRRAEYESGDKKVVVSYYSDKSVQIDTNFGELSEVQEIAVSEGYGLPGFDSVSES